MSTLCTYKIFRGKVYCSRMKKKVRYEAIWRAAICWHCRLMYGSRLLTEHMVVRYLCCLYIYIRDSNYLCPCGSRFALRAQRRSIPDMETYRFLYQSEHHSGLGSYISRDNSFCFFTEEAMFS